MVQMTTLSKATNGDWFARKAIPADVREAYQAAYGVRQEERFRRSSSLPQGHAKADFRDWDAEITRRIEALRAKAADSEIRLTPRQISALAGQWYAWFVDQHSDQPGEPEDWDSCDEMLTAVYDRFNIGFPGEDRDTIGAAAKRHIHAKLVEMGKVETFLAEHSQKLEIETRSAFLDVLELELPAAFGLLRRRAGGDFSPDERLARFALASAHTPTRGQKLAGLDCWQAFEAWVKERQPARSTVNRWRSVFLGLNTHFEKRDVVLITSDEAVKWTKSLPTEKRSGQVANDVWITAAVTVFNWLKTDRKIIENPFEGLRIAGPKKQKTREREFKPDEWRAVLRASLDASSERIKPHKAAARRWIPWLCAYTGARSGEMAQLTGARVYREDGIWAIEITPEDGTVKGGSFRKVPIHEHLVEMGFIDFVKSVGDGPLFYDPKARRKASDDPTKPVRRQPEIVRGKLAEWVRKTVKITDPNISPNHAWRHTFKRIAARADMEPRFRDAFCGHESGKVGDLYETPTLGDMAEELKKFPRYVLDGDSVEPEADETA